jgi:CxxC motif-containing protein (DUF1111 family)
MAEARHDGMTSIERTLRRVVCALSVLMALAACGGGGGEQGGSPPLPAEASEGGAPDIADASAVQAGGATTVARADKDALGQPAHNLDFFGDSLFEAGNHLFRTPRSGLKGAGPLLNAQTCQGCHVLDGRGSPPRGNEVTLESGPMVSMLLRLDARDPDRPLMNHDAQAGVVPDPIYGGQLQTRSVWGDAQAGSDGEARYRGALNGGPALGEAKASLRYDILQGQYPDGTPYALLQPVLTVSSPAYGDFAAQTRFSPRVAPPMHGVGLLGAITEADILRAEDPDDRDGDGVSGRANRVWSAQAGDTRLGRFGLKAGKATVLDQTAGAFKGDMGLTNSLAPAENCSLVQIACWQAAAQELLAYQEPSGVDVSNLELAQVEFYARTLAVPQARGWLASSRSWEPAILAGRRLFVQLGCSACHVPSHTTGVAPGSALGAVQGLTELVQPAPALNVLSGQRIWPYTDLLLHDMGGTCEVTRETSTGQRCTEGEACHWVQRCTGLADGTGEHLANGREWRTPALWGLGLVQVVNPQAGYLHDGRARSIEEAVLWHGQAQDSEARGAWSKFVVLPAAARAQLLQFLASL